MTVNVRRKLINDLMIYLPSEKTPSKVDVFFHFLSLSFSRPLGFYQGRDSLNALPGAVFTCSSPVSVKVTGPSNRGKETPGGKETLLEFKTFSFGLEGKFHKAGLLLFGKQHGQ